MCCFSQPVTSVSQTRIFARGDSGGRQFLAYSMVYEASGELAMVLPLPVKPGSGEGAVKFLDLHAYPEFFDDLYSGFPPPPVSARLGLTKSVATVSVMPMLEVQTVGSFEASYVPTVADFSRLDARFRLPTGTWDQLPAYKSYGFAVFKLKPQTKVHPMAFSFPRATPGTLFFPTVHIHDGKVHPQAHFDHVLYHQATGMLAAHGWDETPDLASKFMTMLKCQGMIAADQHCYRKALRGTLPNQDTTL